MCRSGVMEWKGGQGLLLCLSLACVHDGGSSCVCTDLEVDESDGPLGLPRQVLEEEVLLDGQQPRLPLGRQGAEVGMAQQHGRAHHHLRQREKEGGAEGEGGEEGREKVAAAGRKPMYATRWRSTCGDKSVEGLCLYLGCDCRLLIGIASSV